MASATFFPNGNTIFFDDNGEQVPEIQGRGWFRLSVDWIKENGFDPMKVEYTMPNGSKAVPFETSEGRINWEIR